MKKLLLVLLVVTLASFLFVGCLPTTPAEGEGEGEGEGEVEVLGIVVDGEVTIDGMTYVGGGSRSVTVTFPTPVENVYAYMSDCTGDYNKEQIGNETLIVLWPNADKTVWSGSAYFTCEPCFEGACVDYSDCCASYIRVETGECDWCETSKPVIVDCAPPEVDLNVRFVDCGDPCDPCDETRGVSMEWTSLMGVVCDEPDDCCADDCSGVASWTVTVGDTLCAEPCSIIPGTGCPVEGVSDCCLFYATEAQVTVCYAITFDIVDNVGNLTEAEWEVCLDTDEVISFSDGTVVWDADDLETDWMYVPITGLCMPISI